MGHLTVEINVSRSLDMAVLLQGHCSNDLVESVYSMPSLKSIILIILTLTIFTYRPFLASHLKLTPSKGVVPPGFEPGTPRTPMP